MWLVPCGALAWRTRSGSEHPLALLPRRHAPSSRPSLRGGGSAVRVSPRQARVTVKRELERELAGPDWWLPCWPAPHAQGEPPARLPARRSVAGGQVGGMSSPAGEGPFRPGVEVGAQTSEAGGAAHPCGTAPWRSGPGPPFVGPRTAQVAGASLSMRISRGAEGGEGKMQTRQPSGRLQGEAEKEQKRNVALPSRRLYQHSG